MRVSQNYAILRDSWFSNSLDAKNLSFSGIRTDYNFYGDYID